MECQLFTPIPSNAPLCHLQQISILTIQRTITSWMVEDVAFHGEAALMPALLEHF